MIMDSEWLSVDSECLSVDSECLSVDSECLSVDRECLSVDGECLSVYKKRWFIMCSVEFCSLFSRRFDQTELFIDGCIMLID